MHEILLRTSANLEMKRANERTHSHTQTNRINEKTSNIFSFIRFKHCAMTTSFSISTWEHSKVAKFTLHTWNISASLHSLNGMITFNDKSCCFRCFIWSFPFCFRCRWWWCSTKCFVCCSLFVCIWTHDHASISTLLLFIFCGKVPT